MKIIELIDRKFYFLLFILILKINITLETSLIPNIKIYSDELFKVTCDSHFFYISMKISSDTEIISPISFELNLSSPAQLRMKCILYKTQIECFSFVPEGSLYRQEELFFNLFYTPPKIPGIEFDSISFRKNRRRWENTLMCGIGNHFLNDTKVDFNYWKKFKLNSISGGNCKYFYVDKEQKNEFYFNMSIDIQDENLIQYFEENNERNILFLQEIKAPISIQYQDYLSSNFYTTKDYAFCQSRQLINLDNYRNINLECKIHTPKNLVLNSVIKMHSFFDKIYIKTINYRVATENEIQTLNIFINSTNIEFISNQTRAKNYFLLDDGFNNNILCPNLPIFIINNKNTGIYFDEFNNKTNRFHFILKGTLTNGYKYVNHSLIKLSETTDEICFNLFLLDNSHENLEEIQAKCILSSSSFYNEENTMIKCFGNKSTINDDDENIIIDMSMNYVQKRNNYFNNIIINWPEKQYFGNKKNFYSVRISALSFKRKYSICEDGNYFTFYINIFDINKDFKIIFDLPLSSPPGYIATCETLDHLTLVCTIDLRFKKILKFQKISLPEQNKELRIINEEGNEIIFTVYDKLNYIKMDEDCGENAVFGAMKEIGISKKKGIVVSICLAIFLLLLIGFFFFYIVHCILRCVKNKGKKLPMTEESKEQKEIA